jgi:hypothetical protein
MNPRNPRVSQGRRELDTVNPALTYPISDVHVQRRGVIEALKWSHVPDHRLLIIQLQTELSTQLATDALQALRDGDDMRIPLASVASNSLHHAASSMDSAVKSGFYHPQSANPGPEANFELSIREIVGGREES